MSLTSRAAGGGRDKKVEQQRMCLILPDRPNVSLRLVRSREGHGTVKQFGGHACCTPEVTDSLQPFRSIPELFHRLLTRAARNEGSRASTEISRTPAGWRRPDSVNTARPVIVFLIVKGTDAMTTKLSRRDFLGTAAASLGAATLASSAFATPPKVLVAYATRCGSTREIAQAVTQDLRGRGCAVDLRAADKVAALSGYEAVVLGSAVRFGRWLPEAVDFVRRHQAGLKRIPTAFVAVHMMNTGADQASRKARFAYLDPARVLVKPNVEAFFPGKMDMSRLSLSERLLCKLMKGRDADRRDWPAIHSWAKSVFPQLGSGDTSPGTRLQAR
jgi:menaquinone-dependent protoporphyrinogen oxidase